MTEKLFDDDLSGGNSLIKLELKHILAWQVILDFQVVVVRVEPGEGLY